MHSLPTIGLAPWWRRALIVLGGIAAVWLLGAGIANADDGEQLFGESDSADVALFGDLGSDDGDARAAADRAAGVLDDARAQLDSTVGEIIAPVTELTGAVIGPMASGLVGPLPTVGGAVAMTDQATPGRAPVVGTHGTAIVVGAVAPGPVEMPGSSVVTESADLAVSPAVDTTPAPDAPNLPAVPVRSTPPAVPGSATHGGVDGGSHLPGTPAVPSATVARTSTSVDPTIVRELPSGARAAQPGVRPD